MLGRILNALWAAIDFLQTYNGAVTAVATVFIGLYTYVLAHVTGRQAELTSESIDLARKEFISTHRPRLRVRRAHVSKIDMKSLSETIVVQYVIANIGESDAHIYERAAQLVVTDAPPVF